MEYLSLKDATLQYKVSDRTLRTAIAKLPTDERATSNELIVASLTKQIELLDNQLRESNERQKELNYIIANLTKQIAPPPPTDTPGPKPNTTTDTPFIWFVVGLVFGLVVIGLVVVIYK